MNGIETGYYNVAICPTGLMERIIKDMKRQLYSIIGWFGSCNAQPHLTIDGFFADEASAQLLREQLTAFCASVQRGYLTFNSIDAFKNSRTLFVAPDSESKEWLINLMNNYSAFFGKPQIQRNFNPHMTIGRKIDPCKFDHAKELFVGKEMCLPLLCNNIALRRFYAGRRQFEVVARFYFGG